MTWNMHPGEILREEFMKPFGLSSSKLAQHLSISVPRINDIARERRGITAETALRLAHYFGTTPDFWLNMQMFYDLRLAKDHLSVDLEKLPTHEDMINKENRSVS